SVYLEIGNDGEQPAVVIPRRSGAVRLVGHEAARFLADVLPAMNGGACVDASVTDAVARVDGAERGTRRRSRRGTASSETAAAPAWELIVADGVSRRVIDLPPVTRLALEMAVTEELERSMLASRASEAEPAMREQEVIAEIADDLLVPDTVANQLESMRRTAV